MNEDSNPERKLLKANNVQRRFYVKEVDVLASQAERKHRQDMTDKKAVIYNQHVQMAMGGELQKLLDIRAQIQTHKQEIERLRTTEMASVRRRLNKRGVKNKVQEHYGRVSDALSYYTQPPMVDEKDEDICKTIIGNPQVQASLMDCTNNPPYAEYERAIIGLETETALFNDEIGTLKRQIWGVVSTDEILDLIEAFKERWL